MGRRNLARLEDQQSLYRCIDGDFISHNRKACNFKDFYYFALSGLLLQDPSQTNKVGKAREKKTKVEKP